jgi:hypothetical protein
MKRSAGSLIGRGVPSTEGRTDDGTPIALSDLAGRCLAVFLAGALDPERAVMLEDLAGRSRGFLELGCSPVVVTTEGDEVVASMREDKDYPFIVISDRTGALHAALCAGPAGDAGAWIVDEAGVLAAAVPSLPPREMIAAALSSLVRLAGREDC